MAHWSETSARLRLRTIRIPKATQLEKISPDSSTVTLLWLSQKLTPTIIAELTQVASRLKRSGVLCVLASPLDAAILSKSLQKFVDLKLWIAVKTVSPRTVAANMIPNRHVSLLILTRYKGSLRHVLTRVKYTSCPACHKTTKDYGGKKHMYHSYGTLISDVWTDIECAPETDIRYVTRRLQTLFALSPYKKLLLIDLRQCKDQADVSSNGFKRQIAQSKKTLKPTAIRSRLINADCMTALESLRSDSIDFCFADLPYNLRKKYYRYNDALGEQEYFAWCNEWLSQLHRVLKPGRTLAVLNVPQWSAKHLMFLSSFMDFQAWIVWDALGFPCRKIMPAHYAIVCFSKGRACLLPGLSSPNGNVSEREYLLHRGQYYCTRPSCVRTRRARGVVDRADISDIWSDIHRLTHNSQRVNHPCQLPPLLMRRLFSLFTKQDEAILDCFNGAGTSTLVAQQMGRRFIGIEISRRYHNLALQRHRLISAGGDPFGKRDAIPIVKNSRVIRLMKQPYKVSKKDLQLEVKRIADELKRLPQPEDVKLHSKFPMKYFNDYFTSWSEVCAAARMTLDSR